MSKSTHVHPLSAQDTRWLLREVEAVLRTRGHTWTLVDGRAFQLTDGPIMGLDNLARRLHLAPRRAWRRLVREQVTTLLSGFDPRAAIRAEDLRVRLLDPATMPDLEYEPLRPLPGLHGVLSAQGPGLTALFGKLDTVEVERDDAYVRALENLAALPLPQHVRRRLDPDLPGSWVDVLRADDSFGASRVMVLPEVLRRTLRREIPPSGVLVAVPHKFEMWLHFPVDNSVLDVSVEMAFEALCAWAEEPFPLSPHVYLVSPDMHAEVLVAADAEGASLDHRRLRQLIRSLPPSAAA